MDNIIELKAMRDKKLQGLELKEFKLYLQSLKSEQLLTEAQYLVSGLDEQESLMDLKKGAMLMEELATRVNSPEMARSINEYAQDIRQKIEDHKT